MPMPTRLSPPETESPPETQAEVRLLACQGLIRGAVKRCAHSDGYWGLDLEDLVQEATIEVWKELREYLNAPVGYIWQVAYRAAIHALRRGRSVDRPITRGQISWKVVSLDALLEDGDGQNMVEEALARHKRRGELPDPTGEVAVARIMLQELWGCLSHRQRQVLDLRLQQYSESEAAAILGISQPHVSRYVMKIRVKALAVWGDKPRQPPRAKLTPQEEARERRRERDRLKQQRYWKQGKSWSQRHRDQANARRRARRQEKAAMKGVQ